MAVRCAGLRLCANAETPRRDNKLQYIIHGILALTYLCCFNASAQGQIALPKPKPSASISVSAEAANRWKSGPYDVWLLRGNCHIQQGAATARSREAVLWIEPAQGERKSESKIIAYLEGDVEYTQNGPAGPVKLSDQTWLGDFLTVGEIQVYAAQVAGEPSVTPPIFQRGLERRYPLSPDALTRSEVRPAQFTAPAGAAAPEPIQTPPAQPLAQGRRIRVFPRSDVPVQAQWFPDPQGGNLWIAVIDAGVNMVVDSPDPLGSLDISTDRLVIWTVSPQEPDLSGGTFLDERTPLEIYMEGNIVFRQGEQIVYADRMYYNVPNHTGMVLNAELLTPVKNYEGLLRLQTDVLQQTGQGSYYARNSFLTSSRMGEPGYRLQAGDIYFEDIQSPLMDPYTGQPVLEAATGQMVVEHQRLATSSNNFLFLGPAPVFYWPYLSTDLNDPTYYIRRARAKYDRVYGTQILTSWSGYELLGLRQPAVGTDLEVNFDYLGLRGFGHGGSFTYNREQIFDIGGPVGGLFDYWGISDYGQDNLGVDRPALEPEKDYRFRLFWQHRQMLPGDFQLSAEAGWISDRNFLESYFESEWDDLKDQSTGIELKRTRDNRSLSISADARLNNFFTETEWLPRADHFWLGEPLLNDSFTWYEHSSAAFARFRPANSPSNPLDQPFAYLPWETNSLPAPMRYGERLATRQEIDWPFQMGAVKFVPYALGELARWGQDLNGDDLNRTYWQAGLRTSLPVWSIDPTVQSEMFNVHGLMHKVVFEAEFSYADSNQDLSLLPLYDPLDDNSIEAQRQRFIVYNFGGAIPLRFDERYYAVRTGMGGWVTAPSTEVVDDLMALRLGARQRWQTKRGMPGREHILDWITLDTNVTLFPDPNRDNFGQVPGLLDYDFRWHVGDRLTLVSEGLFDFFAQGQNLITVGGFLSRPPRGSLYLGYLQAEGPIDSRVITLSYTYWMSPKWISTFGTSFDLGQEGNIGQHFSITRIGESLLINAGLSVDPARNDFGVNFSIEPRFLPKSRLAKVGGAHIPPAGAYGLE
jgi:hypothetical protein